MDTANVSLTSRFCVKGSTTTKNNIIEAAVVLYNYGIAHRCHSYASKDSDKAMKLLEVSSSIFKISYVVLSKEAFVENEIDACRLLSSTGGYCGFRGICSSESCKEFLQAIAGTSHAIAGSGTSWGIRFV